MFVDNMNLPHIAVKMRGNIVDELRGIQNGNSQELEEEYREVAIEFLTKNKEIEEGDKWLDKEEWNKRLIGWNKKINENRFNKDEVKLLIQDLVYKDYKAHAGITNSNKEKLLESMPKIRSYLAEYFNCKESEIYFADNAEDENIKISFKDVSTKFNDLSNLSMVVGNANFENSTDINLSNLESITGDAGFSNSKVTDLSSLEKIGGYAIFNDSKITYLSSLKSIGGDADFRDSNLTELSSLKYIGGNANFIDSKVTELKNLEKIGGFADFNDSEITSLDSLNFIGAYADFSGSKIENLKSLKFIGGYAIFSDSKVKDLSNLESIGKDADFNCSEVTDLTNLKSIGGYADFSDSKVKYFFLIQKMI